MDFDGRFELFTEFIEKNKKKIKCKRYGGDTIIFWINPLVLTSWPMWMTATAILCNQYGGKNVKFLVNDCWERDDFILPRYKEQIYAIKSIMNRLKEEQDYEVIYLSRVENDECDGIDLDEIARLCTIRLLESSQKTLGFERTYSMWIKALQEITGRLHHFFTQNKNASMAITAANVYDGYLVYKYCLKFDWNVLAFDCGGTGNLLEKNGISAQLPNLPKSYEKVKESKGMERLREEAKKILNSREKGEKDVGNMNGFRLQGKKGTQEKYDFVIFPNYEADGCALGTHRVFKDDAEWLLETIAFILEHTDKKVAVRQHPVLRRHLFKAEPLWRLLKIFEKNARFKLITSFEEANSYELINNASAIIVNTSTVGLEAAYLGKKVITESQSFYANEKFVCGCKTKEAYFAELQSMSEWKMTEEERNRALDFYGLRQTCGKIAIKFSIQEQYYTQWVKKEVQEIYSDKETKLLIDCICKEKTMVEEKFKYLYENEV